MHQTGALIVNGKSRRGREWFSKAEDALKSAGINLEVSELLKDPRQISPLVKKAIKAEVPLVCVGGGDGTFSAVAEHFIGAKSILGVLPLGTGNSLARDLGIVADVDTAVDTILNGQPHEIDLGKVNDQVFVNVATIGLTTRIAEELSDDAKKKFGRAVYLIAIIKAAIKANPFMVDLELNGKKHHFRAHQVVVGSGQYHGGPFQVTPEASIESGRLSGYVLKSSGRGTLLRYAFGLLTGHHVQMPEVFEFNTETLTVSTNPKKRITIDGEIKSRTPAHFQVLPSAIRVMKPVDKEP